MARALIYTKKHCPYCHGAKSTMDELGIVYTEIKVDNDPVLLQEMITRTGGTTVPQIFLHVGGSDDFHDLLSQGVLEPIIGGNPADSGCDSGTCSL